MHETNFINGIRLEAFKGNVGELLSIGTDGVVCISASIQSITGGLNARVTSLETNTLGITGGLTQLDVRYAHNDSVYTLLTTTAYISGNLQSQINNKQDNITLVAGNNISIYESPLNTFTISASISGGGTSSGIQGREQLNGIDTTFTINHPTINHVTDFPVATLEVDSATSDLYIVGIHNRTSTSFQVTLSGVADANTYILWHISTQSAISPNVITSSGGSIIVTQDGINFNLEVASSQDYSKTFSYNGDDQLTLITDSKGTQSFTYDVSGNLINISGSGSYSSKNFIYDVDGLLTGIEVL